MKVKEEVRALVMSRGVRNVFVTRLWQRENVQVQLVQKIFFLFDQNTSGESEQHDVKLVWPY